MIFKELSHEYVAELVAQEPDVLTPAMKRLLADAEKQICPYCSSPKPILHIDAKKPFTEGSMVPNYTAQCGKCGAEFTLWTGMAFAVPRPNKVG